ncbi:MAG: hypothetical protein A2V21_302220 [Deltaproteobacteria bacterium GWC2_55_46]|nr:MAG: hypothetical protein A2Z79_06440 [Deltaproteobacteria bacterium GWA2_55_82]OGQ63405.1 MAG: hypothetical protein A3I81_03435 [Deltaproteobacteria bacterium RIFCSPLOWO2_02_FULL_55_12]OIJ73181.1 MAG: hypothetical protein A2V21_302220 [Deltaproteobacteria bacterium GWC2_55_46]
MLASCAAHLPKYPPDLSNPVYTVAVLPFYNATNDVGGPKEIREQFQKRIEHRHYRVMPLKEVDELLLNQMGITLGSQLEMTNPAQLGEVLGVDGVIYGYVLNFDDITTGFYNVKKVRAGFKLVDTRTGAVIWSRGLGVKSVIAGTKAGVGVTVLKEAMDDGLEAFSAIQGLDEIEGLRDWRVIRAGATKKAEDAAAISLGEKLLTKALGVHLWLETESMMNWVMARLPSGPGRPMQRDDRDQRR